MTDDERTSFAAPTLLAPGHLKQKNPDATVGQILNDPTNTTGVKITDTRQGANNRSTAASDRFRR